MSAASHTCTNRPGISNQMPAWRLTPIFFANSKERNRFHCSGVGSIGTGKNVPTLEGGTEIYLFTFLLALKHLWGAPGSGTETVTKACLSARAVFQRWEYMYLRHGARGISVENRSSWPGQAGRGQRLGKALD